MFQDYLKGLTSLTTQFLLNFVNCRQN